MRALAFAIYVFCFLIVRGDFCWPIVLSLAVMRDYWLYLRPIGRDVTAP